MVRIFLFALTAAVAVATARAQDALPLNPDVNQGTITGTICVPGWTRSVRPFVATMRVIKAEMLAAAGETHERRNAYQLDHRIPLALGGAPIDRRNLALQPMEVAKEKDGVERCLAIAVCDGRLGIDEAREAIWRDWRAAGRMCEQAAGNPSAFD